MINPPARRRRADAAKYLQEKWDMQISGPTLANYAVRGDGPIYCLVGKFAIYDDPHLDSWAQSRITGPRRKASADLSDEITPSPAFSLWRAEVGCRGQS